MMRNVLHFALTVMPINKGMAHEMLWNLLLQSVKEYCIDVGKKKKMS
jgi:hypothetical protein